MTSTHRILAVAIAAAVLAGLILVLIGSGHATEFARSSWGVVASVARSSWG